MKNKTAEKEVLCNCEAKATELLDAHEWTPSFWGRNLHMFKKPKNYWICPIHGYKKL